MPAREEAEKQLIVKALKDPKFRQSLIRDPRSVISKEFGVEIPADISIKVLEETDASIYLVLPAPPAAVEGGLSDAELEFVAAGKGTPPPTTGPEPTPTPACCPGTRQQTLR